MRKDKLREQKAQRIDRKFRGSGPGTAGLGDRRGGKRRERSPLELTYNFRYMFTNPTYRRYRTILNEAGFRVDVIERQLAHSERNKVRQAYNRAQYLDERIQMMQWYGDYLESVGSKEKVVPLRKTS